MTPLRGRPPAHVTSAAAIHINQLDRGPAENRNPEVRFICAVIAQTPNEKAINDSIERAISIEPQRVRICESGCGGLLVAFFIFSFSTTHCARGVPMSAPFAESKKNTITPRAAGSAKGGAAPVAPDGAGSLQREP